MEKNFFHFLEDRETYFNYKNNKITMIELREAGFLKSDSTDPSQQSLFFFEDEITKSLCEIDGFQRRRNPRTQDSFVLRSFHTDQYSSSAQPSLTAPKAQGFCLRWVYSGP
jgi:hypothetical protein